uniref:growth-regulating factor 5-like isoform X2 n=1 Tax=Erigeron canadensis TaxID=72917 RepID=UPI001CB8BE92|nr:growth-regulating factor 5-like isoform X2 [Erigeron canadensis]
MEMEMLSPVKNESSNSNRFAPFTSSQWQELEHQALVYKYMISGMPIPPDLLFSIKRSLDCSTKLILHNHSPLQSIGWNCFQMGFGKKIDPEPGRCRRTDGKKWRCSKDAYLDSKYCERHMHRGRNRSRKPVESNNYAPSPPLSISTNTSTTKFHNNNNYPSSTSSHHIFGYHDNPQLSSSSSRPNGANVMSSHQDGFMLESSPYSEKEHSYGMKKEVDEHPFLSESCGSISASKQRNFSDYRNDYSYLQLQNTPTQQRQKQDQGRCYDQLALKFERKGEPQKVMHHFFDESPHNDNEDNNKDSSTTQLSISNPSFAHDFFLTHK